MKVWTPVSIALIALAACSKPTATPEPALIDHEILIELGQTAQVTEGIGVTFRRVVEDSRCPNNVVCIWAGNARVALNFFGPSDEVTPDTSLNTNAQAGPGDLVYRYLRVELAAVEPYPEEPGTPAGTYRVRLRWSYLPD